MNSPFSIGYPRVPTGVKWLLIANVAGFLLQMTPWIGPQITGWGSLVPRLAFANGEVWRLVTYMFLHGGMVHLIFNMLALWMFSTELEEMWGTRRFVIFYFIGGIGAGLFSVITWNADIIGASGAVYAVLMVFGYYFPQRQILLFFIVPIPARMAAVVFFLLSLLMGGQVAHFTHLGGIVVAVAYMWLYPHFERKYLLWLSELQEKERRAKAERYLARERYFADVVDPILKKISEQGMASLTGKEKSLLKRTAKTDRERLKRGKVLPFDLFA